MKERFRVHGVECIQAAKPKSDLYKDLLPVLNSGGVELLDNAKAIAQICSLERRTARGGRDSIDHAPGAHDDLANAVAGAVVGTAISQGGPAGWLEYYRRLNEEPNRFNTDLDLIRPAGPDFGFSFSSEPLVTVVVPEPIASGGVVYAPRAGHAYGVRRIGARVIAEMRRADAIDLLTASSVWRHLNPELSVDLGIDIKENVA